MLEWACNAPCWHARERTSKPACQSCLPCFHDDHLRNARQELLNEHSGGLDRLFCWKSLAAFGTDCHKLALICPLPGIDFLLIRHLFSVGEPMILRCGWQLGVEYCDDDPPELLPDTVLMSFDCRGLVVRMPFELQSWFAQVAS